MTHAFACARGCRLVPPAGRSPCSARAASNSTSSSPPAGPQGAFNDSTKSSTRRTLFNTIAPVYDELNDRLSLGRHWLWKRDAVRKSRAAPGQRVLDLCCGSGDLTHLLAHAVGVSGTVIGLDFAQDMLDYAAQRPAQGAGASSPRSSGSIEWVCGDATKLQLDSSSFDAATMGYGLRNVADVPAALRELHRVLKPGACAAILDFNNSDNGFVNGVQAFFLEQLVVPAARRRGLEEEYAYLRPSIAAFATGAQQERLARDAGFVSAQHEGVEFGLMGCLVVQKGSA